MTKAAKLFNDEFVLTQGLGQQLEFAFQRNGWTAKDVHGLCKENLLEQVRIFIESGRQLPSMENLRVARLEPVGQVFNQVVWGQTHGFPLPLRTRLLNALEQDRIIFLWDVVQFTKAQFLRIPNVGDDLYRMVEEILGDRGFCIGMALPELSEEEIEEMEKGRPQPQRPGRMIY